MEHTQVELNAHTPQFVIRRRKTLLGRSATRVLSRPEGLSLCLQQDNSELPLGGCCPSWRSSRILGAAMLAMSFTPFIDALQDAGRLVNA
jgi:hypothetical protein